MEAQRYRLGYRGDIEGLRAIAIVLVVAAHAKVSWLAGGFVGVDVFFVLSGYLITGLLLQEINHTNHLAFLKFYAHRLRRLLPALLVMLAVTCLSAVLLLPPAAQERQAIAAATAATWLSNIHFAFAKLDYFSPGATGNLFLHTWSLGVEEQFYLVWPALIFWTLKASRSKNSSVQPLKIIMWLVAVASVIACIAITHAAPQMAFYLMPLRAWQFATGALVWLYFNDTGSLPSAARSWIGWLGLGLIVICAIWLTPDMAYPGWRAMLPTVGAAAIIAAGIRANGSGVSRALTTAPLQAIGKISYSWYLWHWPVLLLGADILASDSPVQRAGLVVVSLLFAVASYRWVESPIRHKAKLIARPGRAVLTAVGLMAIANVLCIIWFNATWSWTNSPAQQRFAKARVDAPIIYPMGCDDWYHSDQVLPCTFGPSEATHTAVLMGDSIGAQWFPAVAQIFDRPNWKLVVLTKSSCPMVDEPFFYSRIGRNYVECSTWRKHALKKVAAMKPDVVLLGTVQTDNFTQDQWVHGTEKVLQEIASAAGHVYILRSTPELPFNGPDCLASQSWLPWLRLQRGKCKAPAYTKHADDIYSWLQEASKPFHHVTTIDMTSAVCPGGQCKAERAGQIVFRDSQHMTATFARSLGSELSKRLKLDLSLNALSGVTKVKARKPSSER